MTNRHPHTPCRRCGQCCRLGGPALHQADLPLVRNGTLAPGHLLTLRRGQPVTDNVAGGVAPSAEELVKLRPVPGGRACLFLRHPAACAVYASRPAECQALSCQAPAALADLYRRQRLTRADIIPAGSPLAELCAHHEAETDLVRLAALCRQAAVGHQAARAEVLRQLRFDAAFRDLLVERAGADPSSLDFYLGQPLAQVLPACRAVQSAGLYNRPPSA